MNTGSGVRQDYLILIRLLVRLAVLVLPLPRSALSPIILPITLTSLPAKLCTKSPPLASRLRLAM